MSFQLIRTERWAILETICDILGNENYEHVNHCIYFLLFCILVEVEMFFLKFHGL